MSDILPPPAAPPANPPGAQPPVTPPPGAQPPATPPATDLSQYLTQDDVNRVIGQRLGQQRSQLEAQLGMPIDQAKGVIEKAEAERRAALDDAKRAEEDRAASAQMLAQAKQESANARVAQALAYQSIPEAQVPYVQKMLDVGVDETIEVIKSKIDALKTAMPNLFAAAPPAAGAGQTGTPPASGAGPTPPTPPKQGDGTMSVEDRVKARMANRGSNSSFAVEGASENKGYRFS